MLNKFKKKLLQNKELYLRIKVFPRSSRTEVKDVLSDDTIKINLKAIPENGKANMELIKFISKKFKIPSKNIVIINGKSSRLKLLKLIIN